MTYTFKLAQRLARLRTIGLLATTFLLALGCNQGDSPVGPADPSSISIWPDSASVTTDGQIQFGAEAGSSTTAGYQTDLAGSRRGRPRSLATVSVTPDSLRLVTGAAVDLDVVGRTAWGSKVTAEVRWTATGGTVDGNGKYTAGSSPGRFGVVATASNGAADTAVVIVTSFLPALAKVQLTPVSVTLNTGGATQFTAAGSASDGTIVSIHATYQATGGTITQSGLFTAGPNAGAFQVIAIDDSSNQADTAAVTIASANVMEAVVLTPATASLTTGAKQQFTAAAKMSDGTTKTLTASYTATGGSISSSGEYTAGSTAGTYRVIASDPVSGMADTSAIGVQSSPSPTPPPPPPPPPPSSGCARTVNASTLGGFTSALAGALPGDCIYLAPGTYALTSGLTINRSGTAAEPVTIQGDGSNTVIDVRQTGIAFEASYVRLRKIRMTNFGLSGLWFRGATYNVIDSVEIDHTLQWALALKNGSHHNVIQNSRFHDTGTGTKPQFGEAIYISNSGNPGYPLEFTNTDNQILNNSFGPYVRSMAIILCEGADRITIRGNFIDGTGAAFVPGFRSLIASYGNDGVIEGNTLRYGKPDGITFYAPQTRTMSGNMVSNNTIDLRNIHNFTEPYYGFNLTVNTNTPSRVTIKCNNTVTNGQFSNVSCVP